MTVFEKKQAFLGTFSLFTAFLLQYSYNSVACDASLICFQSSLPQRVRFLYFANHTCFLYQSLHFDVRNLFVSNCKQWLSHFSGLFGKNVCVLCFESMWLRRNNRLFLSRKAKSTSKSERFRWRQSYMCKKIAAESHEKTTIAEGLLFL